MTAPAPARGSKAKGTSSVFTSIPSTDTTVADSTTALAQRRDVSLNRSSKKGNDDGSGSGSGSGSEGEVETDEEIQNALQKGRSVKTAKRKRRAVSPTSFGQALSAFLADDLDEQDTPSSSLRPAQKSKTTGIAIPAPSPSSSSSSKPIKSAVPSSSSSSSSALPVHQSHQVPIFSLAPSISSRISSTKLSEKAARVVLEERRSRQDQFRVRDLIGGWGRPGQKPTDKEAEEDGSSQSSLAAGHSHHPGMEDDWTDQGGSKGYERKLRKVAQRGVVKLFNAIRAAQSTTTEDVEEKNKATATAIAAPSSAVAAAAAAAARPGNRNALGGKSKEVANLSKANFLDLIRSTGSGSGSGTGAGATVAAITTSGKTTKV